MCCACSRRPRASISPSASSSIPEAAAGDVGLEPQGSISRRLGWRQRSWSWLLFGAVLAARRCWYRPQACWTLARATGSAPVPLPDDSLWLSGPLASVHHNLGKRCESLPPEALPAGPQRGLPGLPCDVSRHFAARPTSSPHSTRHAAPSCHAEHNEPAMLLRRDDALCARCHEHMPTSRVRRPSPERVTFATTIPRSGSAC